MTIWGLLLIAALIMKFWPETPAARWLHRYLVERPMEMVAGIRRRHIIFLIIGLAVMYSFAEIGAPHLGVIAALDISAYVDVMITVATVAMMTRARGSWTALRARFRPRIIVRRPRSRRTRATVQRTAANDDDRPAAVPLAA
jgi:hypothetical protein